LPLVKKLIERPELSKHVRKLQLENWKTLGKSNPSGWAGCAYDQEIAVDINRGAEPTEAGYLSLTETARDQYIITEIHPCEHNSYLLGVAR
jgi:hypothetical protein